MPDSDLQLTLAADASGVTQGVEQAKAAVADFGPKVQALGASLNELATQLGVALSALRALAKGLESTKPSAAQAAQEQQKLTEATARGIEERARAEQKANVDRLSAERAILAERVAASFQLTRPIGSFVEPVFSADPESPRLCQRDH